MQLWKLFENTQVDMAESLQAREITGISYDTRNIKKGDLFVCIKGFSVDGHTFAKEAAAKGASVILAEQNPDVRIPVILTHDSRRTLSQISANFFRKPSEDIKLFGITGTNGKTSITYMIREILSQERKDCGIIGTIAYEYAGKMESAANTTPESFEIQRILARMRDENIAYCAMEVSSHALALDRVADVKFDYGIFTNLTPDHLDFHNTLEEYFAAKKKLFYLVKKAGIINTDDPYGKRLYTELKNAGYLCYDYSLKDKNAAFYADIINMDESGSSFRLLIHGMEKGEIATGIPGIFSVYNVLAAVSAAMISGVTLERAIAGVMKLSGVPGRFEIIKNNKGITAIVDYAHTPDALENVLRTANSFKKGRLICVFGCGGNRDRTKRPLMGKAAGMHSDYCIITSDNPRTENPMEIITDVEEGVYDTGCNYEIIENRYEAIKRAVGMYRKNDIILVAGKGHEDYQIIGKEKKHFDDREVLRELIQ